MNSYLWVSFFSYCSGLIRLVIPVYFLNNANQNYVAEAVFLLAITAYILTFDSVVSSAARDVECPTINLEKKTWFLAVFVIFCLTILLSVYCTVYMLLIFSGALLLALTGVDAKFFLSGDFISLKGCELFVLLTSCIVYYFTGSDPNYIAVVMVLSLVITRVMILTLKSFRKNRAVDFKNPYTISKFASIKSHAIINFSQTAFLQAVFLYNIDARSSSTILNLYDVNRCAGASSMIISPYFNMLWSALARGDNSMKLSNFHRISVFLIVSVFSSVLYTALGFYRSKTLHIDVVECTALMFFTFSLLNSYYYSTIIHAIKLESREVRPYLAWAVLFNVVCVLIAYSHYDDMYLYCTIAFAITTLTLWFSLRNIYVKRYA